MKSILTIAFIAMGVGVRAQIINQSALTTAGGHQGQIGNYYFEYSLGDLFTVTGQSQTMVNTAGMIQPVLSDVALPVELIAFTGRRSGEGKVELAWATSEETGSARFEIQRSTDGKNWGHIGTVKASGETKGNIKHYEFLDTWPQDGPNVYRLKMIDLDETFAYSKSISVEGRNPLTVSVYPNPASEFVRIETSAGEQVERIIIHNARGIAMFSSEAVPAHPISVKNLSPGIYVVSVMIKGASPVSRKLVLN